MQGNTKENVSEQEDHEGNSLSPISFPMGITSCENHCGQETDVEGKECFQKRVGKLYRIGTTKKTIGGKYYAR